MKVLEIVTFARSNYEMLIRYIVSGLTGVLANLVVFSIATESFGVWYLMAALYGFFAAYIVTFSMHKWWTFTATPHSRTLGQSVLYLLSAIVTLAINSSLLMLFVELVHLHPIVGQSIALIISAGLSFLFTSQVTFHADAKRWSQCIMRFKLFINLGQSSWVLPMLLFLLLTVFALVRVVYLPLTSADGPSYIESAQFLQGEATAEFVGQRLLKPLLPAVMVVISGVFDVSLQDALLYQAIGGFILLGLASYWLGTVLFLDTRAGVLLGIIVATSYPMLRYGLDHYIETGAWALYIAAVAATVMWYRRPATHLLWGTAFLLLLGLLWKEYAVLAGLVFGLTIIFQPQLTTRNKVWAIMQVAALCVVPWLIYQYYIYVTYNYSYLDWLAIGSSPEAYANEYSIASVVKSLGAVLTFAWVLVFFGLYHWKRMTTFLQRMTLFLLVPSFGFVLWGWVSSRLFFSVVPLAAPLAVHALRQVYTFRIQLIMVLCMGVLNLALVWVSFQPDVRGLLDTITYGDK